MRAGELDGGRGAHRDLRVRGLKALRDQRVAHRLELLRVGDDLDHVLALDDVVDHIEHASDLLDLYGLASPTRDSLEQCRILVAACEQLSVALARLRSRDGVEDALIATKGFEDEGDRVVRGAIAALFQDPRIDPLVVIRWKDIYEALEEAIDACETVANVVGNVVLKNA